MDDNAVIPGTQNTQNQPISGTVSPVQNVVPPVQSVPSVPEQPLQPVLPVNPIAVAQPIQSAQAPVTPQGVAEVPIESQDKPRLTLADLYGPSTSQEVPVTPSPAAVEPATAPIEAPSQQPVSNKSQEVQQEIQQPLKEIPMEPIAQPAQAAETIPVSSSVLEKTHTVKVQTSENVNSKTENDSSSDDGGFHFAPILRFVIGGAVILLILLLVWGIGSFIFSPKNTGNQKVSLTYWGLWEDPSVMQSVLADYQKQHPNVTITYTKQDPKDYVRRLLTRMQDGSGPDIFRIHNTWVYPLQSILLPLPSSVIDKNQLDKNFPHVITQDLVTNGAVYGLPLQMDTLSLFINSDIFTHAGATAPTTWDNFITTAKALTVKDPNGRIQTAGAAIGTYENVQHAPDIISLLLVQNGANIQKLNGSQNAKDALSFYTSFAKPDGNVWDGTLVNSLVAFSTGKAAMYFGYSYDIFAIKAANPNLHFAVYPVPHLPGRDMTIASYWVEGVSNRSKHPKESLDLMQYLSRNDIRTRIYTEEAKQRSFGELYAPLDLAEGLKSNSLLLPFVSQYKTAQSSFFSGDTGYDEYNGALNRYLGNAVNSVLKNTSPESSLTTLSQGVDQVISQFTSKTP